MNIWKEIEDFELGIDYLEEELENLSNDLIIYGNKDFKDYNTNEQFKEIFEYCQSEDICEHLTKETNKNWKSRYITGCSQRDWQICYFTDNISNELIEYIESLYFGYYKEYSNGEETVLVCGNENPHDILDGKIFNICGYNEKPIYNEV